MKTNESPDHGGEDAVWVKLAVPATRELRDGLVDLAEQTGVTRATLYHLAMRRGLESLRAKGFNAGDLTGLVPSPDYRRYKRSPPKTSGGDKS